MDERGRTVLLLDENQESKKTIKKALESAGYTVWEASNGLRLVSRLHVDQPDVVVMHTSEAWADCFDLCQSLKSSDQFRDVRVVLVTDGQDQSERARSVCCDRMVTRSTGVDALLTTIRDLVENQQAPEPG